jgi:GNAT superfamily N-acetyltransferase
VARPAAKHPRHRRDGRRAVVRSLQDVGVLELRCYEEAHASSVRRLHEDGLRQMNAHAGDGSWDDDLRSVRSTYLENQGEFFLGVVEGEVVAMGALRRVSATIGEVKRMRVDARFQRQGFGRAILRRLEARAREMGYRTLRLDTTVKPVPAQRLYEPSGYRAAGRTLNPAGQDIIVFEKRLAP